MMGLCDILNDGTKNELYENGMRKEKINIDGTIIVVSNQHLNDGLFVMP